MSKKTKKFREDGDPQSNHPVFLILSEVLTLFIPKANVSRDLGGHTDAGLSATDGKPFFEKPFFPGTSWKRVIEGRSAPSKSSLTLLVLELFGNFEDEHEDDFSVLRIWPIRQ
ncbi:MAG TPA: hypothetical protein VG938_03010 [Verrucomicrobiae bacterium]|nr:hypothetical protein [Verrucomicrobiae bacterium]